MVALLFGQVNASLRLIVKGASTEGVDCEGRNIVHLAAEQHNVTVLEVSSARNNFFRYKTKCPGIFKMIRHIRYHAIVLSGISME